jgi:hypothetical protein
MAWITEKLKPESVFPPLSAYSTVTFGVSCTLLSEVTTEAFLCLLLLLIAALKSLTQPEASRADGMHFLLFRLPTLWG